MEGSLLQQSVCNLLLHRGQAQSSQRVHEQGLLTSFQEFPQAKVADSLVCASETSFPTGRDTGHSGPCILGPGPGQEGMEWPPGVLRPSASPRTPSWLGLDRLPCEVGWGSSSTSAQITSSGASLECSSALPTTEEASIPTSGVPSRGERKLPFLQNYHLATHSAVTLACSTSLSGFLKAA